MLLRGLENPRLTVLFAFGFALGDVAGKGPPAALLSAMMQGIFAAQAAVSIPVSDDGARESGAVSSAVSNRGS